MRFDLHHPANRRRPCIVVNPGRGDYVVAGVAVHPKERLLLFQDRNKLALALLVPRVILHRAGVCPLVLLRRSSDSQTLGDGKNAFIRIDGDKSKLGLSKLPLDLKQKKPKWAMLYSSLHFPHTSHGHIRCHMKQNVKDTYDK